MHCAAESAAHALIPDPDVMLRRMLVESIEIYAAWTGKESSGLGLDEAAWAEACRLTVAANGRSISWPPAFPHRDGPNDAG